MSLAQPSTLCSRTGCYMIFLTHYCYFSCVQKHLKPSHWASPVVPFPEVLKTTSDWPGQTLGKFQNPDCQMCPCQHATCSGRKPIFYFFLLWEMCLFLASVPTYPASHTETEKSFHFSIHLSHLKKGFEFSLNNRVGFFVFLYVFKIFSLTCSIFAYSSPSLFLFRVLMPSLFPTFDYTKEHLLNNLRCFLMNQLLILMVLLLFWNILSFIFRPVPLFAFLSS